MTSPADNLPLREFAPRAEVVTPVTRVERPRFPVIDAHNHLGELLPGLRFSGDWLDRPVEQLLAVMDEANVRLVVDLDGRTGEALRRELARYQEPHPQRFAVFCGIDYDVIARERDFGPPPRTRASRRRRSRRTGPENLEAAGADRPR